MPKESTLKTCYIWAEGRVMSGWWTGVNITVKGCDGQWRKFKRLKFWQSRKSFLSLYVSGHSFSIIWVSLWKPLCSCCYFSFHSLSSVMRSWFVPFLYPLHPWGNWIRPCLGQNMYTSKLDPEHLECHRQLARDTLVGKLLSMIAIPSIKGLHLVKSVTQLIKIPHWRGSLCSKGWMYCR